MPHKAAMKLSGLGVAVLVMMPFAIFALPTGTAAGEALDEQSVQKDNATMSVTTEGNVTKEEWWHQATSPYKFAEGIWRVYVSYITLPYHTLLLTLLLTVPYLQAI